MLEEIQKKTLLGLQWDPNWNCQEVWSSWWYVAETVKIIHFCLEIDVATERLTFLFLSQLVTKINLWNSKGSNFTSKFYCSAEYDKWELP